MSSSAGHCSCSGSAFLERPLAGSSMPVVVHADQRIVIICHDPCNGNFVPACQTHRIFLRTVYVDMCAGPNIRRQPSVIILTTPWLRAAIPYAVELLAAAKYQAQAQEGTEAAVAVSEIQVEEQQVEGQAQAQEGA